MHDRENGDELQRGIRAFAEYPFLELTLLLQHCGLLSNYKKADAPATALNNMSKSTASKTQSYYTQFRMKFLLSFVGISTLSNIGAAQLLDLPPLFDPYDPKFDDWQPAGPDDCK